MHPPGGPLVRSRLPQRVQEVTNGSFSDQGPVAGDPLSSPKLSATTMSRISPDAGGVIEPVEVGGHPDRALPATTETAERQKGVLLALCILLLLTD